MYWVSYPHISLHSSSQERRGELWDMLLLPHTGNVPGPLCGEILSGLRALSSHRPNPHCSSRSGYRPGQGTARNCLRSGGGEGAPQRTAAIPQCSGARPAGAAQRSAARSPFPHSNEPPRAVPRGTSGFVVLHAPLSARRRRQPDSFSPRASGRGGAGRCGAGRGTRARKAEGVRAAHGAAAIVGAAG